MCLGEASQSSRCDRPECRRRPVARLVRRGHPCCGRSGEAGIRWPLSRGRSRRRRAWHSCQSNQRLAQDSLPRKRAHSRAAGATKGPTDEDIDKAVTAHYASYRRHHPGAYPVLKPSQINIGERPPAPQAAASSASTPAIGPRSPAPLLGLDGPGYSY